MRVFRKMNQQRCVSCEEYMRDGGQKKRKKRREFLLIFSPGCQDEFLEQSSRTVCYVGRINSELIGAKL